VPMSGLELPFGKTPAWDFAHAPPTMFLHGTADGTVPYYTGVAAYLDFPAPKFLVSMVGAPHTFFIAQWLPVTWKVLVDFFDRYLKDEANGLTRLKHDAVVDGVSTLTKDVR